MLELIKVVSVPVSKMNGYGLLSTKMSSRTIFEFGADEKGMVSTRHWSGKMMCVTLSPVQANTVIDIIKMIPLYIMVAHLVLCAVITLKIDFTCLPTGK